MIELLNLLESNPEVVIRITYEPTKNALHLETCPGFRQGQSWFINRRALAALPPGWLATRLSTMLRELVSGSFPEKPQQHQSVGDQVFDILTRYLSVIVADDADSRFREIVLLLASEIDKLKKAAKGP